MGKEGFTENERKKGVIEKQNELTGRLTAVDVEDRKCMKEKNINQLDILTPDGNKQKNGEIMERRR